MYFLVIEGKKNVVEIFNETFVLMNLQKSKTTNGTCYLQNYFFLFLLFLLVMVFVVITTKKIKCFIENRNIKLLNIQPESDRFD